MQSYGIRVQAKNQFRNWKIDWMMEVLQNKGTNMGELMHWYLVSLSEVWCWQNFMFWPGRFWWLILSSLQILEWWQKQEDVWECTYVAWTCYGIRVLEHVQMLESPIFLIFYSILKCQLGVLKSLPMCQIWVFQGSMEGPFNLGCHMLERQHSFSHLHNQFVNILSTRTLVFPTNLVT